MTTVLLEPFNSLAWWSNLVNATIVAGRNGTACQIANSGSAYYTFPPSAESADVTYGFAWQTPTVGAVRYICALRSDNGGTTHLTFQLTATGAIEVRRGTSGGTVIGTTAATGLVAAATWVYIEIQAKLSDTVGFVIIRVNGTERLNLPATQDTRNAGTKTVFDTATLGTSASITVLFDDLYVKTGAGETFRGDTAIVATPTDYSARHNTRVALKYTSPTVARRDVRVALKYTSPTLARYTTRVAAKAPAIGWWDGTTFVTGTVRRWTGTAWVLADEIRAWTGSDFK